MHFIGVSKLLVGTVEKIKNIEIIGKIAHEDDSSIWKRIYAYALNKYTLMCKNKAKVFLGLHVHLHPKCVFVCLVCVCTWITIRRNSQHENKSTAIVLIQSVAGALNETMHLHWSGILTLMKCSSGIKILHLCQEVKSRASIALVSSRDVIVCCRCYWFNAVEIHNV